MTDYVHYEVTGGVATLHMDDGKANAYGPKMIEALSVALDRAAESASVAVISGRPGVLCAGFDLNIIRGDDSQAATNMRLAGKALLLKAYLHPQPVVFACTGHALAAGALLLLTGDYRIGTRGDFKIGLNETGIGLALPHFGLELARDRLEPQALSRATITAQIYAPENALAVGYLDELADPETILDSAHRTAVRLKDLDNEAVRTTKQRLRQATVDRILAAGD